MGTRGKRPATLLSLPCCNASPAAVEPALSSPLNPPCAAATSCLSSLGTTSNPSKLKKKLRKHRLATTKGVVKGQAKKANPLAGANQFHKKHKKKR